MSSLEAVNKTLFGIREDTDELNKNFNKFFLEQQRGKLDAEEDRRERAKMLAALGAAAAAAAAANERQNRNGEQQQNEQDKNFSDFLKKAGLVLAGVGAAVTPRIIKSVAKGTYKVTKAGVKIATLPQKVGNTLGEKALRALSRKGDMDAIDLENAKQRRLATQLTDLEAEADSETRRAKQRKILMQQMAIIDEAEQESYRRMVEKQRGQTAPSKRGRPVKPKLPPAPITFLGVPDKMNLPTVLDDGKTLKYLINGKFVSPDVAIPRLEAAGFQADGTPIPEVDKKLVVDEKSATKPSRTMDEIVEEARKQRAKTLSTAIKTSGTKFVAGTKAAVGVLNKSAPALFALDTGYAAQEVKNEGVDNQIIATGIGAAASVATLNDMINSLTNMALGAAGVDYRLKTDLREDVVKTSTGTLKAGMEYIPPNLRPLIFDEETLSKPKIVVRPPNGEFSGNISMTPMAYHDTAEELNAAAQSLTNAAAVQAEAASTLSSISGTGGKPSGQSMLIPFNPTYDINYNKIEYGIAGGGNPTLGTIGVK